MGNQEGFLEEVSLRRGLKEDCEERLTPGRPTTSMSSQLSQCEVVYISNCSINARHPRTMGSQFGSSLCRSECSVSVFRMDE